MSVRVSGTCCWWGRWAVSWPDVAGETGPIRAKVANFLSWIFLGENKVSYYVFTGN